MLPADLPPSPDHRTVVGVDLAWGRRGRTGVVVARGGRVVGSATVGSDDEIAALVPDGPVLVAVDAPVVVPNRTGRRGCDAELSRCFGRYHAGAYPANRSLRWFDPPRAEVLADRLGLDRDPWADRSIAEVYPHAALVALHDLERVLPYKAGRGRDLAVRRTALLRLLDLLEHDTPWLDVTAGPRWRSLRDDVADAPTMAALGRVEDEVDAHVCAVVGVLAALEPDSVDVVGRVERGAVLVPRSSRTSPCIAAGPDAGPA